MAWTSRDIPDQHGHVAVVTGANSGLGLATARELARRGAHVIMASRNRDRSEEARRSIEEDAPGADLELRDLDLASLDSVRSFATAVVAEHPRIDLLINNAGVMGIPERATVDGFEMQLGVNHLGHFVLTRHLLPSLLGSPAGRVVSVTSFARYTGRAVDPEDPHLRRRYDPWRAYGRSKLANVHFAVELHRRLEAAGANVASLVAHPGLSHTELQARSVQETGGGLSQRFWHLAARNVGMAPDRGALPQLRAAADPDARGGRLYAPRWGTFGAPVGRPLLRRSLNPEAGRRLWEVSERETGERFDVAGIVAGAGRDPRE
ncbi:MAG: SDR family NAD(P)-dependent oxidoreductase [Actinobacteria bacterium]|nr:SDR family NAD(P)-dependent oxidoreductase [Actinomycetota bacterium]